MRVRVDKGGCPGGERAEGGDTNGDVGKIPTPLVAAAGTGSGSGSLHPWSD